MEEKSIPYRIIRSKRKTAAIQITSDGEVIVRCPKQMSSRAIQALVDEKSKWILGHLQKFSSKPKLPPFTPAELRELSAKAKHLVCQRVAHFAPLVGVSYSRITIRAQRTRWGSCSSMGNLNFNCLLALTPPEVLDYVVVHELCHRKQLNHSPAFWNEVANVLPNYQAHRNWLKTEGSALIARLPKP